MQVVLEEAEDRVILSLPKSFFSTSPMTPGSLVDVSLADDKIVLAPARRSKYTTEELLAGVTDDNIHPETDWGPPVGKEVW